MGVTTTHHETETETETAPGPRQAAVATPGLVPTLGGAERALALQRSIGNRALVRLIQRETSADAPVAEPQYLQDARAGRWEAVAKAIVPLPIGPLLDALEQLRSAELLATFGVMVARTTRSTTPRGLTPRCWRSAPSRPSTGSGRSPACT